MLHILDKLQLLKVKRCHRLQYGNVIYGVYYNLLVALHWVNMALKTVILARFLKYLPKYLVVVEPVEKLKI